MLTVYGDESHDEAKQRVFAVAGVIGSDDDWRQLEADWLARAGGPIHSTDLETQAARDPDRSKHSANLKLYADLVRLITRSNLLCFASVMDLEAWHSLYDPAEVGTDMPYYKCFSEVVIYFARIAEYSIPPSRVRFVFDRSEEREYNAHQLYSYMRQSRDWPTSNYIADEIASATKETVGIQVADVIAREAMKYLENEIGPVRRPLRGSMRALLDAHRIRCEYFTREYLEKEQNELKQLQASGDLLPRTQYLAWLESRNVTDTLARRLQFQSQLGRKKA